MRRTLLITCLSSLSPVAFGAAWAQDNAIPDYYPEDYDQIVAAAAEEDDLVVYGNIAREAWQPVIDHCSARFPEMPEIQTLDLGATEVFERYYTETAGGADSADFMLSIDPGGWLRFIQQDGVLPYQSPELEHLPDWSYYEPGLYMYSADPTTIAYSKVQFSEGENPTGVADLAAKVEADPAAYQGNLSTYSLPEYLTVWWPFINSHTPEGGSWEESEAWPWIETLGPSTQPLSSSGPMVEGIMTGQYAAAYLTSSGNPRRAVATAAGEQLLGYNFIDDGTPIWLRGIAIPQESGSPNAAKLLLDCILSSGGQIAVAEGDYTAYRPDVAGEAKWHLQSVLDEVGEENALFVSYDDVYLDQETLDAFVARWNEAMGR
ncbi:ABC transporter substrate-binding protein [Roseitranquillus sediminis]|uniref:ABC transporter substrate-binding protein n=1 Tax=Roseitranquillus sediminis TaxID=2809051 RepID=UPI001D0C4D22|nr:ABC transporter substrate-binding protein [Roseitranquillus sediminis]MBM9593877.1 ABC transporter substrate-binding protein [Roseitranquillus sediminis]